MTLQDQTRQSLSALGTFSGSAQTITAADGDLKLTCELAALEALGCELVRLNVESPTLAGASADKLKKIATTLSGRLTYLMEPISPIEVDQQGCVVQLRSSPPQRNDDGAIYYELLVRRGGELTLARYRKVAGQDRQSVAAQLTREVLLRLVEDFANALA
ncbi:MAG: hypothetical protein WD176_06290 [Pirellulales bacterium]